MNKCIIIMQDAHGKDTFYMKNGLCGDCKKHLQKILGYDLTGCKSPLGGVMCAIF